METTDLGNLTVAEKFELVTKLWDEIASSPKPIAIPQEILDEASRRSQDIAADPSILITDEEMWRRVDGR